MGLEDAEGKIRWKGNRILPRAMNMQAGFLRSDV